MTGLRWSLAIITISAAALAGVFWRASSAPGPWKRENPLVDPVAVLAVRDGSLSLADGRTFRPAGVKRQGGVSPESYDGFLRVAVEQGVVVARDLGDGRASLLAEPKYYEWCGTCRRRSQGVYVRCDLAAALIHGGYAEAVPDEPGLTPRERWRLDGVSTRLLATLGPERYIEGHGIRRCGSEDDLARLDEMLGMLWKPPPEE